MAHKIPSLDNHFALSYNSHEMVHIMRYPLVEITCWQLVQECSWCKLSCEISISLNESWFVYTISSSLEPMSPPPQLLLLHKCVDLDECTFQSCTPLCSSRDGCYGIEIKVLSQKQANNKIHPIYRLHPRVGTFELWDCRAGEYIYSASEQLHRT